MFTEWIPIVTIVIPLVTGQTMEHRYVSSERYRTPSACTNAMDDAAVSALRQALSLRILPKEGEAPVTVVCKRLIPV